MHRSQILAAMVTLSEKLERPLILADMTRYFGVPMSRVSFMISDMRRQEFFGWISQEPACLTPNVQYGIPFVAHVVRFARGLPVKDAPEPKDPCVVHARKIKTTKEGIQEDANVFTLTKQAANTLVRLQGRNVDYYLKEAIQCVERIIRNGSRSQEVPKVGPVPIGYFPRTNAS